MKNIIKGFGLALALITTSAHAIPTLFFDGDISYDQTTGLLSVSSVLTSTFDIAPSPTILGSSLDFTTLLSAVDSSNSNYTVGLFGTTAGTDLSVVDGDSNSLLTGNFSELTMKGGNGLDFGLVTGTLDADGGTLQDMFDIGNLIALEFNLSTSFSTTMFDYSFDGLIDGRIEGASVPEPTMPALLALGILLIGFVNRAGISRRISVDA
jgi:hypothetical protein